MCKYFIYVFFVLFISSTVAEAKPVIDAKQLERFTLKQQVPAMNGYDIRARKIVVHAGGSINKHAHTDRAGIVYIESGEIIEYRGSVSRTLKAGDSLVEDVTTIHSYKNVSNKDCVLIAFDIPKTEKQ